MLMPDNTPSRSRVTGRGGVLSRGAASVQHAGRVGAALLNSASRPGLLLGTLAAVLLTARLLASDNTPQTASLMTPRESHIPAGRASLYARDIGRGRPILVLHGGPDFDHGYLLPDMDRLADEYRLIYYDQRGRGQSVAGVQVGDVTLASDIDDVDRIRRHFQLTSTALLGHSWGTVLALEYALRHPSSVSHLILMNPAPAAASDAVVLRKAYAARLGGDMARQNQIVAGTAYTQGDPEAVIARYRIHFRPALERSEDYERLMATMRAGFIRQGKEGILMARAVENQLMRETWGAAGYDLMPKLTSLRIPTLVVWGDHDFIPAEIATHIVEAIPNARLVTLQHCGHFAYLECADDVRKALDEFLQGAVH
jgi:proline iminopeptidase